MPDGVPQVVVGGGVAGKEARQARQEDGEVEAVQGPEKPRGGECPSPAP